MPFLTNSDQDVREMLKAIGVNSFEDLLHNIPSGLRFKGNLQIPESISEIEISNLIDSLGNKNKIGTSFLGGGVYDHYIPAVIDAVISRSEFYTAYTPYQPEVSQGTLQSIYEFQSLICELTSMDVTNASMYEGGSALAEAMLLAANHTRKKRVLIASTLNRRYKRVLKTYISHNDIEIVEIPEVNFNLDLDALKSLLKEETAAVIVQQPNFFGYLEDVYEIQSILTSTQAMFISYYDPVSLGLIAPPGEYGADIAIAEGQALGNRQSYGGPFIGLFSTRDELIRKIPGRLSGMTADLDGKRGFVLTLQTREQHIRREKATSNICTNSGLLALAVTVYLSLMGKEGIREVANLCLQKSHYMARELSAIDGVKVYADHNFFKEFVAEFPVPETEILSSLSDAGIRGGLSLVSHGYKNALLIAVTEKRTREEIDTYLSIIREKLC